MKRKTQREVLQLLIDRANKMLDRPDTAYIMGKDGLFKRGKDKSITPREGHMYLDGGCGGYRVEVMHESGGCSPVIPTSGGRLTKPKLEEQVRAFLSGIEQAQKLQGKSA